MSRTPQPPKRRIPRDLGPYRIESPLGAGGMGEVYRAYDHRLDRRVALKFVRPEVHGDARIQERFQREARTIASLNHPSIVQIFDILRWENQDCIVMEWVEGETLSTRLERGPLSEREALSLGRDLAKALAYAHARGIIHRDLKADNVLLATQGRAKILDFGVAKRLSGDSSALSLSRDGRLVGTLYAMSPEQCQGKIVDHRSDLFSLGILLYQATTGESPFRGASAEETVARICVQRQVPAVRHNPYLSPEVSDLLERLLEKDPAQRPQTGAEVVRRLEFLAATQSDSRPPQKASPPARLSQETTRPGTTTGEWPSKVPAAQPQARSRPGLRIGVLLGLLAVMAWMAGVFGYSPFSAKISTEEAPPWSPSLTVRPSVALLSLENHASPAWKAEAIPQLLAVALGVDDHARILEREEILQAEAELALSAKERVSPRDLERLRQYFGVQFVISGSLSCRVDQEEALTPCRLQLRLYDTNAGERSLLPSTQGVSPLALAQNSIAALRKALGLESLSPPDLRTMETSFPASDPEVQAYFEALLLLREGQAGEAREILERGGVPVEYPRVQLALARSLAASGDLGQARRFARQVRESARPGSPRDQLRLRADSLGTAQDWQAAEEAYRQLFEVVPDDPRLALDLAKAQVQAGFPKTALETLDRIAPQDSSGVWNPHIDLTRSWIHYRLGSFAEAATVASHAVTRGKHLNAGLLVARARLRESIALRALGRIPRSEAALEEAMLLFEASSDQRGSAGWLHQWATNLYLDGRLDGSRRLFERVLDVYLDIGDQRNVGRALYNLGGILAWQGDPTAAESRFLRARDIALELGADRDLAHIRSALAYLYITRGDLARAQAEYQAAREVFERLADAQNAAQALNNLAGVLFYRGDLAGALEAHREALARHRMLLDKSGQALAHLGLGDVYTARGDFSVAEEELLRALRLQEELGERTYAAQTRLSLALVHLLRGDLSEAEQLARRGEEILTAEGLADLAALGQALLGTILLTEGKIPQAQAALREAGSRASSGGDPRVDLTTGILAAQIKSLTDQPGSAAEGLGDLRAIARRAADLEFIPLELEARLRLCEIEMQTGDPQAEVRLLALIADARSRDFGQIVERALRWKPGGPP